MTPAELLASHADHDCIDVTTVGRVSGRLHVIEIWFGVIGAELFLISGNGPGADWYRNLLARPTAVVRFPDGQEWTAAVRPVVDPDERRAVGDLMGAKYAYEGDPSIGLTGEAWCYDVPVLALAPTAPLVPTT